MDVVCCYVDVFVASKGFVKEHILWYRTGSLLSESLSRYCVKTNVTDEMAKKTTAFELKAAKFMFFHSAHHFLLNFADTQSHM